MNTGLPDLAGLPELADLPDLDAKRMDEPAEQPDPFADIQHTGDAEADSKEEMSALLKGFAGRAKAEKERFVLAVDSGYWCAVCFQTRAQKEAFLRALKLLDDALMGQYIDGQRLAKALGIELPKADVPYRPAKLDRRLAELPNLEDLPDW